MGHVQKRQREPTPIIQATLDGNLDTVVEAPNSVTVGDATTTNQEVDQEERVEDRPKSSEQDEPSVLFSEQLGTKTEPTEAIDDGEALPADTVPAVSSPTEFVEEGDETQHDKDLAATIIHDPSPSTSPSRSYLWSDNEGSDHYQDWTERYARDDRLSSSDGEEDLELFIDPTWELWTECMDEKALDHFNRFGRKMARQKKHKRLPWLASREDRITVSRKPRTTREDFEEGLMEGVEMKSYHSGDSDDFLMDHRPPLERAGVKKDIKLFTQSMDLLSGESGTKVEYQVIDRLGEGSSTPCTRYVRF
jgi:hypothetical protein